MIAQYDFATPTYDEAIQLRDRVLRAPLGLSISDDDLSVEHDQLHFGAFAEGTLVGTATLQLYAPGVYKMRQVAVDPDFRGQSVGRALVRACEAFAKTRGVSRLFCHARMEAHAFYVRCGWVQDGEGFTEVGLPHVVMVSITVG